VVQQLASRQYAARIEHEVAQQPVLGRTQIDRSAAARDFPPVLVELEVLEDHLARLRVSQACAPQDRAHPSNQRLQTGVTPLRAEAPGRNEAVNVRQHDVEDHQMRFERPARSQRVGARGRRLNGKSSEAQRHRDDADDVRLRVDDENAKRWLQGEGIAR